MNYDLICFRDGSKATKSLVALCVSQIKMMVLSPDGWPVLLHLIEISQHNRGTSKAEFSPVHLKRLVSVGILIKQDTEYGVHPVFRNVLLEGERQNNIYAVIYNKLVYNRDPAQDLAEEKSVLDDGPEDEEEIPIYGPPKLFKELTFAFDYYNSQTKSYSNLDYKPDDEFDIPNGVRGYINSLTD